MAVALARLTLIPAAASDELEKKGVDLSGLSALNGEELIEALRDKDAGDIIVICGGVIPQQDYEFLRDAGVKAIFGPGTNIPQAARDILALIRSSRPRSEIGRMPGMTGTSMPTSPAAVSAGSMKSARPSGFSRRRSRASRIQTTASLPDAFAPDTFAPDAFAPAAAG